MLYQGTVKVRMEDTDMADVLFFANQFKFAHRVLEDFLEEIGYSFDALFHQSSFCFVIVHAEADYKKPLRVGDILTLSLYVDRLGKTSCAFRYQIEREGEEVGQVKTVHVCLDRATKEKKELPPEVQKLLTSS